MELSNEQIEKLMGEYQGYTEKIVNRFYYFVEPHVKDELCHVGLIGLWKGILAYYKKVPEHFDQKRFLDTICAYIRYEMANLFRELKLIRLSDNRWRNFVKANRLLTEHPDASEEKLPSIIADAGLRYDWYVKTKEMINPASFDMTISEDSGADIYNFVSYHDNDCTEQSYMDYIIDSAMYGIKQGRDKELIRAWLNSVHNGEELNFAELGRMYHLTPAMVRVIINRFMDICRFVRDCEDAFLKNPDGVIYMPEIAEKNRTHNGRKIPGVKWVLPNRKWKVEIRIDKKKSIYIGYFKEYENAVRARRDAEIKYRGFSDIEIS